MKIGYWAIRGRGQPLKNLAHYLELKYGVVSYLNPDEWFNKDKAGLGIPFANLPYLIDEKVKLTETKAIMKYLCIKGKKEEMLGKTPMDQVYMEQIEGVVNDWTQALFPLLTTTDEAAAYEKVFNEKLYPKMNDLNSYLQNQKFIAGDYLTWVDFLCAEFIELIQAVSLATIKVNLFEKYSYIGLYQKRFMEQPKIKEFYENEENKLSFLPSFMAKLKI